MLILNLVLIFFIMLYSFCNPGRFIYIYISLIFIPIITIERLTGINLGIYKVLPSVIPFIALAGSLYINQIKIYKVYKNYPNIMFIGINLIIFTQIFSNSINGVDIISSLLGLRWIILTICVSYLTLYYSYRYDINKIMRTFILIGIVQLPICLFQRIYMVSKLSDGHGDMVCGLFPQYYQLLFFQLFVLSIIIYYSSNKIKLFKRNHSIFFFMILASLSISNSKIIFIFVPLVLAYSIYKCSKSIIFIFKYIPVAIIIFSIILVIFNNNYNKYITQINAYGEIENPNLAYIANPQFMYEYTTRGLNLIDQLDKTQLQNLHFGRLANILINWKFINENLYTRWFGFGSVGYLESSKVSLRDRGFQYILGSTLSRFIGASGLLGLLSVLLFIFSFRYLYVQRQENSLNYIFCFILLLMSFYYSVLQSPYTYLIISIMLLRSKKLKELYI